LWSIGKDSTTLLWLCKKSFFGKIPFKVIHLDTGYKFKEIYEFRKKYTKEWELELIIAENLLDDNKVSPLINRFECCNLRKTEALKLAVKKYGFDALLLGIRRDEHGIRGKERYFSPRNRDFEWKVSQENSQKDIGDSSLISLQDTELSGWNIFATEFGTDTNHVRVHPLLHWSEQEIWEYIEKEKIPVTELYFSKNGKRYRSIGCEPCCMPVISNAKNVKEIVKEVTSSKIPEREGRAQDKENTYNMEKLRSLGYM
jgi:sulfate adenylyltransferase subunit 2